MKMIRIARRLRAVATTSLMAALVAGCGANGLPSASSLTTESTASAGAGAAFPATAAENADPMPVPFGDYTATASSGGGREVIAKPTLADIFAPSPLPEMSWGSNDAPVTIVMYASLTCPHCRHFHRTTFPELKSAYIDTGKVRFILREFPIGKTSGMATIALRCAPPDKYLTLYGKYMDQQASWVSQEVRLDPIFAVAQQVGMTRAEFDACRENQGMIEKLKWVKDRGRKLGIIGTPNYFVGDQLIKKELTMADIRAYVESKPQLGASAATAAAGQ